jgi:diguanylate cyclase (GGDEF)-like protein
MMEPDRDNELAILQEVAKTLTSTLDLKEVLAKIMEIIAQTFKPEDWSLLMLDEERQELYFEVSVGSAAKKLKDLRMKLGEGIVGWVAKNGQPIYTADAYQDQRFAKWVDEHTGFRTRSVAAVPLISKGKVLGVIELLNADSVNGNHRQTQLLEALADFVAIAIENARFVAKIKELTIIDDVTGLYNSRHLHTLLETEISRSIRYQSPFSLIFMDLDFFKLVNDNYGHLVGSRLLHEVGQVLKFNLRTIDWGLRYGGDEFIIILPQSGKKEGLLVCQRLRQTLNDTVFFEKENLNIRIHASWGIATFPDDAKDKENLIKQADQSMYLVKRSGRNGIAVAGQGLVHS